MAEFSRGPSLLQQQAMQYQTPSTMPLIQRSQYLAQALQNMQNLKGEDIRNPGALFANLAAVALYNHADRQNNAALYDATNQAQDQRAQTAWAAMAPQDGSGQPMPMPAIAHAPYQQPGGDIVDAIQGLFRGRQQPAAQPAPSMPSQGPVDTSALASTLQGGQPPMSAPQVPAAPSGGPSAPLTSTDSLIAAMTPKAAPMATGGAGPMLDPSLMVKGLFPGATITSTLRTPAQNAAVGGVSNSAHLTGQGADFLPPPGVSPQQAVAQLQAQYPGIKAMYEGPGADHSTAPHVHVDTRGVQMPPAQQAAPGAGGGAGVSGPGPGVAPPPPGPGGPPQMQPQMVPANQMYGGAGATPRELAEIRLQLAGSPMDQQMAQQKMWEIAQRQSAPIGPKDTAYVGADGQWHSARQYSGVTSGPAPGTIAQTDFDNQVHVTGVPNAVQGGQVWNPTTNRMEPIPQAKYGMVGQGGASPAPSMVGNGAPKGKPTLTPLAQLVVRDPVTGEPKADPRMSYFQKLHDDASSGDLFNNYQESTAALGGLSRTIDSFKGSNGSIDQAALDSYLRSINPKGVVRQTTVEMFLEHQGIPAQVAGFIQQQVGNGYITPETLPQIVKTAQAYNSQSRAQLQAKMNEAESQANAGGVTLGFSPLPDVPKPTAAWYTGGNGQSPSGGNPPNSGSVPGRVSGPSAGAQGAPIPLEARQRLWNNPHEAAQFEAIFGPGSAQRALAMGRPK